MSSQTLYKNFLGKCDHAVWKAEKPPSLPHAGLRGALVPSLCDLCCIKNIQPSGWDRTLSAFWTGSEPVGRAWGHQESHLVFSLSLGDPTLETV